jgi:hypothetical protein
VILSTLEPLLYNLYFHLLFPAVFPFNFQNTNDVNLENRSQSPEGSSHEGRTRQRIKPQGGASEIE